MEITEVRVKLIAEKAMRNEKLRAFCSITVDDEFVVRDLKVIEGAKGAFVAMPSRKLTVRCAKCGGKNPVRANYCNECGKKLPANRPPREGDRVKLHADIAHPINSSCREKVQNRVLEEFRREVERAQQPGYRPAEYDDEVPDYEDLIEQATEAVDRGSRAAEEEARAATPARERVREGRREADLEPEDNFGAGIW
ncbi:MAG: SpoVG family protein [Planctomycetes bacterium]|nr:SpoVG family protein [Planctomycetota bacterium]